MTRQHWLLKGGFRNMMILGCEKMLLGIQWICSFPFFEAENPFCSRKFRNLETLDTTLPLHWNNDNDLGRSSYKIQKHWALLPCLVREFQISFRGIFTRQFSFWVKHWLQSFNTFCLNCFLTKTYICFTLTFSGYFAHLNLIISTNSECFRY